MQLVADTAAAQLRRVLHLIPRLADGKDHSVDDVASEANTTTAQLMSDFASISERFDAPGGFVDGVSILVDNRMVSMVGSHFHRPMRLTMRELCALELGLMLLRRSRTPAEQAPIDRALVRLRQTVSRVPANDRHEGTRYADLANAGVISQRAAIDKAQDVEGIKQLIHRVDSTADARGAGAASINYDEYSGVGR